ncbi:MULTISPECIES: efflux RND transporter permease subunit [Nitrosomonas]|nr:MULTISPECIES: efflux RND transporter permease subunit [Nitrosomonas]UVS61953.1 efflux RND transporter permease subunit [Nitrosomonas sp. PLL12]
MVNHNKQDDVVQGIVLLIKDKNITEVILVQKTIHTVEHNMLEGISLILVILFIFLRRIVASLVIIIVMPLSLLFAFILVDIANVSANLISLGAIDFGIIVDSAVVLVEALMVKMIIEMPQETSLMHMRQSMLMTAGEMARPILFSKVFIILAMIPIFTFERDLIESH